MAFKKLRAVVLLFSFVVLFIGAFTILTSDISEAGKCCWVVVCSDEPPFECWSECRPCPPPPDLRPPVRYPDEVEGHNDVSLPGR